MGGLEQMKEMRLRLIEAASQLPGVRIGVDHEEQMQRAIDVATLWYTFVNAGPTGKADKAPKRPVLGLKKKG